MLEGKLGRGAALRGGWSEVVQEARPVELFLSTRLTLPAALVSTPRLADTEKLSTERSEATDYDWPIQLLHCRSCGCLLLPVISM